MGILQARILEWVAMPSARGSSQPRDRTRVSCIAGGLSTIELWGKSRVPNLKHRVLCVQKLPEHACNQSPFPGSREPMQRPHSCCSLISALSAMYPLNVLRIHNSIMFMQENFPDVRVLHFSCFLKNIFLCLYWKSQFYSRCSISVCSSGNSTNSVSTLLMDPFHSKCGGKELARKLRLVTYSYGN